MEIEFNCQHCGARLAVPADTAGRVAECPNCQAQMTIPTQSEWMEPESMEPLQEPSEQEDFARQVAEQGSTPDLPQDREALSGGAEPPRIEQPPAERMPDPYPPASTQTLGKQAVTAEWILRYAASQYAGNLASMALLGLVVCGIYLISNTLLPPPDFQFQFQANAQIQVPGRPLQRNDFLYGILGILVTTFCAGLAVQVCLAATRGSSKPFKGSLDFIQHYGRLLGIRILITILAMLLSLLVAIPLGMLGALLGAALLPIIVGIVMLAGLFIHGLVYVRTFMSYPIALDRNLGVLESLTLSNHLATGNGLAIFGSLLVTWLLGGVLTVVTCGFGLILVLPFVYMVSVCMYRLIAEA